MHLGFAPFSALEPALGAEIFAAQLQTELSVFCAALPPDAATSEMRLVRNLAHLCVSGSAELRQAFTEYWKVKTGHDATVWTAAVLRAALTAAFQRARSIKGVWLDFPDMVEFLPVEIRPLGKAACLESASAECIGHLWMVARALEMPVAEGPLNVSLVDCDRD